ncbi:replicative DNA helicase [Ferrimonas balearica]|uniref:replicative DNA helicase n=1 Tax=Ferrimonas balearica TaxID=44012 RepID=UPI001F161F22|nr:DnaB-like helicase C-terminal domain-containing protein [Ferrimonas balearica]MBY6093809.1 hypothetical protein [Ferrimonas balearica]
MAFDNEMSLIGSVLLDPSILVSCTASPTEFEHPTNQQLWLAMGQLARQGKPVDLVTVAEVCGQDVIPWVSDAMRNTPSTRHWQHHHDKVRSDYQAKKIGHLLFDASEQAKQGDLSGVPDLMVALARVQSATTRFDATAAEAAGDVVQQLQDAFEGNIAGMPWTLRCLTQALGILQNTDLVVIAARPAMGKTALGTTLLPLDVPVGFISGEMSRIQVAARLMAQHTDFRLSSLRTTPTEQDVITARQAQEFLGTTQIQIYDKSAPTIGEVEVIARRWKVEYGIRLLLVDYVQLLRGGFGPTVPRFNSKTDEVGYVVEGLKSIAKSLDVPVIALAQVNRSVESREDKRPYSGADIKDSGVIEQTADIIGGLYRHEVYNPQAGYPYEGLAELIISKNRHGRIGTVYMGWQAERVLFTSIDPTQQKRIREIIQNASEEQQPRRYAKD